MTTKSNLLHRFQSILPAGYGTYKVSFEFNGDIRSGITHDAELYEKVKFEGRDSLTTKELICLRDIVRNSNR